MIGLIIIVPDCCVEGSRLSIHDGCIHLINQFIRKINKSQKIFPSYSMWCKDRWGWKHIKDLRTINRGLSNLTHHLIGWISSVIILRRLLKHKSINHSFNVSIIQEYGFYDIIIIINSHPSSGHSWFQLWTTHLCHPPNPASKLLLHKSILHCEVLKNSKIKNQMIHFKQIGKPFLSLLMTAPSPLLTPLTMM